MTDLSVRDVLELLDDPFVETEPWQMERLRRWIESLVEARGRDYVRANRREVLARWERHSKDKFKTCL